MTVLSILASVSLAVSAFALSADPTVRTGTIQRSYECTDTPDQCAPGLVCAGHPWRKTCVVPKNPGMQCRIEPFWVCRSELVCENDVCKIPRGGVCTNNPTQCAEGLSCDGKGTEKRCITYKAPGMGCPKRENFWICQPGLTCDTDEVCKIPRGKTCTDSPKFCVKGTSCDGKSTEKRCIVYKQPGMPCPRKENFWICRQGLVCNKDDVCKIPVGGSCSAAKTQCVAGSKCVSKGRRSFCVAEPVEPRKLDEKCDNKKYRCQRGLTCDMGVCKLSKFIRCEKNPSKCVTGTACVGVSSKKLCVPLQGPWRFCDLRRFRQCRTDLVCHNKRCVQGTVGMRGSCQSWRTGCKAGLVCGGPANKRICVKPMQKGQFCKGDPYWKCAFGLYCHDKYCREL